MCRFLQKLLSHIKIELVFFDVPQDIFDLFTLNKNKIKFVLKTAKITTKCFQNRWNIIRKPLESWYKSVINLELGI